MKLMSATKVWVLGADGLWGTTIKDLGFAIKGGTDPEDLTIFTDEKEAKEAEALQVTRQRIQKHLEQCGRNDLVRFTSLVDEQQNGHQPVKPPMAIIEYNTDNSKVCGCHVVSDYTEAIRVATQLAEENGVTDESEEMYGLLKDGELDLGGYHIRIVSAEKA